MKRAFHCITIAALASASYGCSDSGALDTSDPANVQIDALGTIRVTEVEPGQETSTRPSAEELHEFGTYTAAVLGIVHRTDRWDSADRQLRAILDTTTTRQRQRVEQMVGTWAVRSILQRTESSPLSTSEAQSLGFYTSLLLDNGSAEAATIAASLNRLAPYWTPERIEAAAQTALSNARSAEARRACDGCTAEQMSRRGEAQFAAETATALRDLEALE